MALQTKTLTANAARGHHRFTLTIAENSTSTSSNASSLSFSFVLGPVQTSWNWAEWGTSIAYTVNIGGNNYTGYIPDYDGYSEVTLKSGSLSIGHDSNGSKQINIGFSVTDSVGQYYTCGNAGASDSMTLTKIPRMAEITSAPDFNDEQNPTISYLNAAGNSVSSLQACISLTGASDDVPYRDIDKTGSSYTFYLSEGERNTLRNATPGNSRSVIFFIRTIIDGVTYHSTLSKTFVIVNGEPTFTSDNVGYADANSSITAITQNPQLIVRNLSNLSVTYSAATARKGAAISSYSITINGVTKTSTAAGGTLYFGTVNSSSNLTLSAFATDSRGNVSSTIYKTITVCDYYAPSFKTFNAYRADSDGSANMSGQWIKWDYGINYASVSSKNTYSVRVYGIPNNAGEITSSGNMCQANDDNTYNVYAIVTDSFGSRAQSFTDIVYGPLRVINISADGTNVAIGKIVDANDPDGVFDCRWKIKTGDPVNTLQGLSYRGDNLISTTETDTTWNWNNQGNLATTFYNQSNQINGQPSQYGFVLNVSNGPGYAEAHQLWMEQNNGSLFHRGGNGDGMAAAWKKVLDSENYTSYAAQPSVVLYNNSDGTTDNATLSETAANFAYVEIFLYKDEVSGWWSVKVPEPNNKTVQIGTQYYANDSSVGLQIIGKTATIIGTTIIQNDEFYMNFSNSTGAVVNIGTQRSVKIMRVIGYK